MNGLPWARKLETSFRGKPTHFLFRQNFLLFASCFGFAVILWMYVAGADPDPGSKRMNTHEVKVQVTFTHTHLHVLESDVSTTAITLQSMSSLPDRPVIKAYVDLDSIDSPGRYKVPINLQVFPADPDITATAIPDHVTVFLDDLGSRTMPVAFHGDKHPSPGFVTGLPVFDPEMVTVSGPSSLLNAGKVTAAFDLNNVADDVDVIVPVQVTGVPDSEQHLFSVTPPKVRLYLPVQHSLTYDTVTVQPYLIGVPAAGVTFQHAEITPPTVTVSGPAGSVEGLTTILTNPINLTGVRSSFEVRATVVPPPGVRVESKNSVIVRIKLASAPAVTLPAAPVPHRIRRSETPRPSSTTTGAVPDHPGQTTGTVLPPKPPTTPTLHL